MVQFEKCDALTSIDSGRDPKEAFFYQVPCVTLRDETEWVKLVASGWNRLAQPLISAAIADAVIAATGSNDQPITPNGQGDAAQSIVDALRDN